MFFHLLSEGARDAMRLSLKQSAMHLKFLSTTLRMINVYVGVWWWVCVRGCFCQFEKWVGQGCGGGVTMWHCTWNNDNSYKILLAFCDTSWVTKVSNVPGIGIAYKIFSIWPSSTLRSNAQIGEKYNLKCNYICRCHKNVEFLIFLDCIFTQSWIP